MVPDGFLMVKSGVSCLWSQESLESVVSGVRSLLESGVRSQDIHGVREKNGS